MHYFERTGTARADYDTIIDGVHFPAWLATVADALAWMRTQPGVDPNRIALIGISYAYQRRLSTEGSQP